MRNMCDSQSSFLQFFILFVFQICHLFWLFPYAFCYIVLQQQIQRCSYPRKSGEKSVMHRDGSRPMQLMPMHWSLSQKCLIYLPTVLVTCQLRKNQKLCSKSLRPPFSSIFKNFFWLHFLPCNCIWPLICIGH